MSDTDFKEILIQYIRDHGLESDLIEWAEMHDYDVEEIKSKLDE